MNIKARKTNDLPPLINDVITDSKCYIDNLFANTWKKLKLNSILGCSVNTVMQEIDQQIQDFFIRSLQLDVFTLQLEYENTIGGNFN